MRIAITTIMMSAFVAGCSQTEIEEIQPEMGIMPTAGIYHSFDAKGGGQVLADGYVLAPGQDAPMLAVVQPDADIENTVAVARAAASAGDCWNGSEGVRLGSILLCAPRNTRMGHDRDNNTIFVGAPSDAALVSSVTAGGGSDDAAEEAGAAEPTFTAKYDRIETVYGTRNFNNLDSNQQDNVRDYYRDHGADGDWTAFGS